MQNQAYPDRPESSDAGPEQSEWKSIHFKMNISFAGASSSGDKSAVVLYQGMTSVMPQRASKRTLGFSPPRSFDTFNCFLLPIAGARLISFAYLASPLRESTTCAGPPPSPPPSAAESAQSPQLLPAHSAGSASAFPSARTPQSSASAGSSLPSAHASAK